MINQDLIHKIFNPNKYIITKFDYHYEISPISNSNKEICICNDKIYKQFTIYKYRKNCLLFRYRYITKIVISESFFISCLRNRSLNTLLND